MSVEVLLKVGVCCLVGPELKKVNSGVCGTLTCSVGTTCDRFKVYVAKLFVLFLSCKSERNNILLPNRLVVP